MKILLDNKYAVVSLQQWWSMNRSGDDISVVFLNTSVRVLNGVINIRLVFLNVQLAVSINT